MAIVIAMSPSVTVSIGELTMGVLSLMFLVMLVVRSTCQNGYVLGIQHAKRMIMEIGGLHDTIKACMSELIGRAPHSPHEPRNRCAQDGK